MLRIPPSPAPPPRRYHLFVKLRVFTVSALTILALGCGRQRQPNVPPGEERVFAKTRVVEAASGGGATGVASRGREDEVVSEEEARRRAKARDLARQFEDAKSGDDRLLVLDAILRQKLRAPELVPHVARSLTDPDPDQRIYAVKARVVVSPRDALKDVKLVLADPDPKARQAAVEAFAMLPDPLPFDALFARLESEHDPVVQQAAMLVFAGRATEVEVPRVMDLVSTLDLKAVGPVVDLARKFPAVARGRADQLAWFLDRNDADLRMHVAKLLGEWGTRTPAVISGLVRALNDPEQPVRKAAFQALRAFSSQEFGYDPDADQKARQESLAAWRAWAKQAAGEGKGPEERAESGPASR